jgi:hypothetical protein
LALGEALVELSTPEVDPAIGAILTEALETSDDFVLVLGVELEAGLRLGLVAGPRVAELVVGTLDGPPLGTLTCPRT